MNGGGTRTVLVVADSSDALTAAERLDGAYRVVTATSADEALATVGVDTDTPLDVDALVTAAFLPDRPGTALLETLREHEVGARTAVLAPPGAARFPKFDVRVDRPVTGSALSCAVSRLVSLHEYDARVDHLYELARRQGRRDADAPPVGDGGFDAVDEVLLEARAAADSALTDVRAADHDRLLVEEAGGAGAEEDST